MVMLSKYWTKKKCKKREGRDVVRLELVFLGYALHTAICKPKVTKSPGIKLIKDINSVKYCNVIAEEKQFLLKYSDFLFEGINMSKANFLGPSLQNQLYPATLTVFFFFTLVGIKCFTPSPSWRPWS